MHCVYYSHSVMQQRPPDPTLFPYTTLFRSPDIRRPIWTIRFAGGLALRWLSQDFSHHGTRCATTVASARSEEHTSELQSQFHLVCRLLLEKKNTSCRCIISCSRLTTLPAGR